MLEMRGWSLSNYGLCADDPVNNSVSLTMETPMPEKRTLAKARQDRREGKAPSTQAGEFIREQIEHIREGRHGARSAKQAIAIGLSQARRAGVDLPPPAKGKTSEKTRKSAERALLSATERPHVRRPRQGGRALRRPRSSGRVEAQPVMRRSPGRRAAPLERVPRVNDRRRQGKHPGPRDRPRAQPPLGKPRKPAKRTKLTVRPKNA